MASFPEEIPGDDLIQSIHADGCRPRPRRHPAGGSKPLGDRASALCTSLPRLRSAQFERSSAIGRLLCRGPARGQPGRDSILRSTRADDGHRWLHRDRLRPVSSSGAAVRPAHPGLGRSALVSSRCSSAERRGRGSAAGIGSEQDPTRQLGRTPPGGRLTQVGLGDRIAPDFAAQAGARENVLSRALRDLGRLVKTQFILRWIENPDYRRRIHRQLNKGEALHALRRFLFFAHQGKVQRRQADQQTNQVLCLNLVTNAIVTWNTVYMNAAIERLRAEGRIGRDIDPGHLSPALYGHVNPYGKYRFEIEGRAPSLRPLRSPGNNA